MAADCPGDGSALPFFNSLTIKGVQMISADTDPNLYTTFEIPETDLSQTSVITTANVNPGKVAFQRLSNIDNNIPEGTIINENTFAVIIGNESYANEIPVKYARNDAAAFRDYMLKTMGIPEEQVHFLTDATYGTLLGEIDWIKSVARAYNGDAKIIFYYAGHGMPDESSKSAYILPTDGNASQTRTAIKVEELYAALTEFPTQQATVFLDACFSGAAREGMLASGRGVTIKPKTNALKGNLVVFTAVTDDQTAHPYEKEKHGMFSYFLMKKIQETGGNVTYQELAEYISKEVGRKSVILGEEQTPRVNVSLEVQDAWKSWKF